MEEVILVAYVVSKAFLLDFQNSVHYYKNLSMTVYYSVWIINKILKKEIKLSF